jgi:hypothetical protein
MLIADETDRERRRKLWQARASKDRNHLRRSPAASDINPFIETTALFALDIDNVSVAAASATDTVLLDLVRGRPVFVLFDALLFIIGGLLEVGDTGQLTSRGVGRAMLDGGVAVTEVTEVVNITRCKKGTGGERVNRRITPLE